MPPTSAMCLLGATRYRSCWNISTFARLIKTPSARFNSSDSNISPIPPLLAKIREDLKGAMRAKNKPKLNVIRNVLGEAANAEKKETPLQTDVQILNILKKRIAICEEAVEACAGRPDLQAKEQAEIAELKEYASQVRTLSSEEITEAVEQAVQKVKDLPKVHQGAVLKELFRPGGLLDGKPVEKSEVAKIVKKSLEAATGS